MVESQNIIDRQSITFQLWDFGPLKREVQWLEKVVQGLYLKQNFVSFLLICLNFMWNQKQGSYGQKQIVKTNANTTRYVFPLVFFIVFWPINIPIYNYLHITKFSCKFSFILLSSEKLILVRFGADIKFNSRRGLFLSHP